MPSSTTRMTLGNCSRSSARTPCTTTPCRTCRKRCVISGEIVEEARRAMWSAKCLLKSSCECASLSVTIHGPCSDTVSSGATDDPLFLEREERADANSATVQHTVRNLCNIRRFVLWVLILRLGTMPSDDSLGKNRKKMCVYKFVYKGIFSFYI